MRQYFILILILGLIIIAPAEANYLSSDSKPLGSLFGNTAYNLRQGRTSVDLFTWYSYGITDRLQIGSNMIFNIAALSSSTTTESIARIYNINVKYQLSEETDASVASAIAASSFFSSDGSFAVGDIKLYVAKFIKKNVWGLHASAIAYYLSANGSTWVSNQLDQYVFSIGAFVNNSERLRTFYELEYGSNFFAGISLIDYSRAEKWRAAAGLEWAVNDTLYLQLGAQTIRTPLFNVIWRF